jgi:Flp pilus assembly protein TadB
LNERVDELKDVMIDNIDKVVQRGERLEDLVQSTDDLAQNARVFKRGATKVKRFTMCRCAILVTIIVVLLLIAILIIILIIVGVACPHFKCK